MVKFEFDNKSRLTTKNIKPIIRSQNSSCAAVFYRYEDPSITKLVNLDTSNDKTISGKSTEAFESAIKSRKTMIVRQDISSCIISNDKSGIGGSFTIVIKRGKKLIGGKNTSENVNYAAAINPGDWVSIYMKKDSQLSDADLTSNSISSGLKFLGIVENVRMVELDNPETGVPTLQFVVTGRSFGKAFDVNVFFNPLISKSIQTLLGVSLTIDSSKIAGKKSSTFSPDEMVKRTAKFFMQGEGVSRSQANEQWYVPQELARLFKGNQKTKKAVSFFQILDIEKRVGLHQCSRGKFNRVTRLRGENIFLSLPSSGTIWSILQYVSNQATNELFTELIPVNGKLQPGLIHRQLPFSNRKLHATSPFTKGQSKDVVSDSDKTFFVDLPRLTIKSTDIINKSVGKSDHERINFVIASPRIVQKDYNSFFMTAINPPSVQRYGLKTYQTQTPYVLESGQNTIKPMMEFTVGLLVDFFFLAHNLYNGTLVIDGVNEFFGVGDNVYISDVEQLFHIEGYTHTYQVGINGATSYVTELQVTRGQNYNGKVASFIGATDTKDPTTVVTSFVPTKNQDGYKRGR